MTAAIGVLWFGLWACSDEPEAEAPPADACATDADCVDIIEGLLPCEQAFCDANRCSRRTLQDDTVCGPGVCSEDSPPQWRPPRLCLKGLCLLSQPAPCEDNEICTKDGCDPSAGCTHTAAAGACDDGSKCTTGDVCKGGVCTGGAKVCECEIDKDCIAIDDGNPCNGTLICNQVSNTCKVDPSSVIVCESTSDTDCKQAQCDPALGICVAKPLPDGTACDDGVDCTTPDTCTDGICSGIDTCK